MDEQWRPVYDKCMQAIFNAQLQPSTDAKHSDLCTQVLGLSINNINDVFSALEILASIKCLPFVTGEVNAMAHSSFFFFFFHLLTPFTVG